MDFVKWMGLALMLALWPATVYADSVVVKIMVMSDTKPPFGVAAQIYRKNFEAEGEEPVAETDGTGVATVTEANCSPKIQFRAQPISRMRYRSKFRWEPCTDQHAIEFVVSSTRISRSAEDLLAGKVPAGWLVPEGYPALFDQLSVASKDEQWGAVAKLSSQLAKQYNTIGLRDESDALAEISVLSTVAHISSNGPFDDLITGEKSADAGRFTKIWLSPEGKKAVAEFQQSCGISADGIIGWKTMGCLPGGDGYTLPSAALDTTLAIGAIPGAKLNN